MPARTALDHELELAESPEPGESDGLGRAAGIGARLGAVERRLCQWPSAGFALLVAVALLLWLLTAPGR
jgi:hypothetical protein